MKKWIEFNLNHPKTMLVLLLLVTVIAFRGMKKLYVESSKDALMPKDHIVYRLGERAKEVFTDSRTFVLVAIEPTKEKGLLSYEAFSHLNELVTEIEEFKNFDLDKENKRLQQLIDLGDISVIEGEIKESESDEVESISDEAVNLERKLDKEVLLESDDSANIQAVNEVDIWDLTKREKRDFYVKPIRNKNTYNYESYRDVTLDAIREKLDPAARNQLQTILRFHKLDGLSGDHKLSKKEFSIILEAWEDAYLYKSMEIVRTFLNPISGQDIIGTENELKLIDFVPKDDNDVRQLPRSKEDFQEYSRNLLRNPSYNDMLYSLDEKGEFNALAMNFTMRPLNSYNEIAAYFFEVIEKYNQNPLRLTPVGSTIFNKFMSEYIKKDMKKFMPLVILVIIVVFIMNFRSVRGVMLPLVSVILGAVWTFGLMGHLGVPITIVVNLLFPFLIAVGSSYSIHIFNQYLYNQKLIEKEGKKAGLLKGMVHISTTVMLAALTTFIGFMTLTVNKVISLKHFGIFSAVGTIFALIVSLLLIPSALVLMKTIPLKKKNNKSKDSQYGSANFVVRKIISGLSHISLKHPLKVIIIAVLLIIIFAFGLSMLKVETGAMYNFKKDSYVYQSDMRIGKLFKGSLAMNLVVDSGHADGVKNPGFLKLVEEIRSWITSAEGQEKYHHLHTFAFGDIVKRMHMAMNGDNPEYYGIPDDESTVRDYFEIFSGDDRNSDGRIDLIEQFVDSNYRYLNIILKTGYSGNKIFSTAIGASGRKRIENYLTQHPQAKQYRWKLVGNPINIVVLADLIVKGLALSVVLMIIFIAIAIFILFRNLMAGLLAIIPISTCMLVVYGSMGFLGIPLDLAMAILAAVGMGIGVDDTIHMMKTLRFNLSRGLSLNEAMKETYREAGVAIIYTSLALIFGFSVMLFSEFTPIFYLGWLVALTMIATTVAALVFLPAVIVCFKNRLGK